MTNGIERINEIWAIITEEDDAVEGIMAYPMSEQSMIIIDESLVNKLIEDAKACNAIWKRKLSLVKFNRVETVKEIKNG